MTARLNFHCNPAARFDSLETRLAFSSPHGNHVEIDNGSHGLHEVSTPNVKPGDGSALFDFTNAFYLANGIDPTKIAGRPTGADASSTLSTPPDANHSGVRIKSLNGMHDDGGKANFFGILGTIQATAFTNNAAGQAARQIADKYVAYIFPKAGSNPLSPASKRQDELIPLNNGYFSNDPLEIWREAFVNYIPGGMNTKDGQKEAADLIKKNGLDADGTPMIRTINDLTDAQKAGLVTITKRADDGSQGAPWFFCETFKEFRGALTTDSTLTVAHNADGTVAAGSNDILSLFNSLKPKSGGLAELA